MRDSPSATPIHQDQRQPVERFILLLAVGRGERARSQGNDRRRHIRSDAADFKVHYANFHLLKDRAVEHVMGFDDVRLAAPVHAHDVDPLGVVGEKLRQCLHVVMVPGVRICRRHRSDVGFVRSIHRERI